jgi:hypothetical protein
VAAASIASQTKLKRILVIYTFSTIQ